MNKYIEFEKTAKSDVTIGRKYQINREDEFSYFFHDDTGFGRVAHKGSHEDLYKIIEETGVHDPANPNHYNGTECLEALSIATAKLKGEDAFCTGNAIKYLWRWKQKNGVQDLEKAKWYIQRLIDKHSL